MPNRPVQTTCPHCGRYDWHERTIKHAGAAPTYKCLACRKEHRKEDLPTID